MNGQVEENRRSAEIQKKRAPADAAGRGAKSDVKEQHVTPKVNKKNSQRSSVEEKLEWNLNVKSFKMFKKRRRYFY